VQDLGNAVICGNNHSADTPYDDGVKGWAAVPPFPDPDHCQDNELVGGSVPGVWCSQTVSPGGNAQEFGTPGILDSQGSNNFYTGPWDCFNMSQADFWSFVGSPRDPSSMTSTTWNGVFYLDNNTVTRDGSCQVGPNGVDGEGFLYVDG